MILGSKEASLILISCYCWVSVSCSFGIRGSFLCLSVCIVDMWAEWVIRRLEMLDTTGVACGIGEQELTLPWVYEVLVGTRAHDRLLSRVNKRVLEHRMSLVRFRLMYGCVIMELVVSYFSERRLYLLTTLSSLLSLVSSSVVVLFKGKECKQWQP